MRVATDDDLLEVAPGSTTSIAVDVVNNGQVIDGISARLIGISDEFVSAQPQLLPLFPDSSGRVTLSVAVPKSHPAGRHPLTVEVVSHGAQLPSEYLDVNLEVAAHPGLRLATAPQVIRARRGGRFVLELTNEGNVALDITLRAVDVDRAVTAVFSPAAIHLEPGVAAPVLLDIRGPRMITGGDVERPVTVEALARLAGPPPEAGPAPEPEQRTVVVRLRQRPLISRGLLTALILAGIVLLWAAAFLLGISKVFGNDPMTKAAPASFFAASNGGSRGSGSGGSGSGGSGSGGGAGAAAPAGALSKTGQLPPGTGGAISGLVRAKSNGQPVGRILVQAWRKSQRNGTTTFLPVSSAASQSDGTYTLAGLFPTEYYLEFSAKGYRPVWYPNTASRVTARPVGAVAQGTTTDVGVTIAGDPATVAGKVDPGDTLTPTTTTVTARPLTGGANFAAPDPGTGSGTIAARTTTAADGSYTLRNLPAPGSYLLTFATDGYRSSTLVDSVGGGENRLEPALTLGAGTGTISGTVKSNGTLLGGATVTTTVAGKTVSLSTPTTGGLVGAYSLSDLPTPATYVLTFAADGHGTRTTIVDLGAGQSRDGLRVSLSSGTGSVHGRLLNGNGNGLGGATVTVGGASSSAGAGGPTTTTLTDGDVGAFVINGLHAPGSYSLTFERAGYAPATVPVELRSNGAPPSVTVRLESRLGAISGVINKGGTGYVGATVTATNGTVTRSTTSSARGGGLAKGGYLISDLESGTYSVTVTANGLDQETRIVIVTAPGATKGQDLELGGGR